MIGYEADKSGSVRRNGEQVGTVELPNRSLQDVLGSGVNGIVFLAWNDYLDRDEIIKVYPPRIDLPPLPDYERHEKARLESSKIARVVHPGVPQVFEFDILQENGIPGLSDGWPYCVMEYREGRTLKSILPGLKDDFVKRRLILRKIFDVLTYAEKRNCLHGDLHMENVLVDLARQDPVVSVVDFGTSMLAYREKSESRHARLLRRTTCELVPELREVLVETGRLRRRVGLHMLPTLRSGLDLVDVIEDRLDLTSREIGVRLADAAVFNYEILTRALYERLPPDAIPAVKHAFLEFLTCNHDLHDTSLNEQDLEERLSRALEETDYGSNGHRIHDLN